MTPQLSIILTTSGKEARIKAHLKTMAAVREECQCEWLIVAGGARKGIELALSSFDSGVGEVLLLPMEDSTAARARQLGATRASGDVLLFLDDDTVLSPGAATAHLAMHGTTSGGVVVGNTRWAEGIAESQFHHWVAHRRFRPHRWAPGGRLPAGEADPGHWSVSRETFAPYSFDEKIRVAGLETHELFARLAEKGIAFRACLEAQAITSGLHGTEETYRRAHRLGEGCRALGNNALYAAWLEEKKKAGGARPRWLLQARRLGGMPDGPFEWGAREGHAFLLGFGGKALPEDILGKGYPGVG